MTEQEKKLLIRDCCARLPYGLKLNFYARATNENVVCTLLGIEPESERPIIAKTDQGSFTFTQDHVKPYLRPMDSMTDDERDEYNGQHHFTASGKWLVWEDEVDARVDFLDLHFLDHRGLIGKGLALEAPEGMYVI